MAKPDAYGLTKDSLHRTPIINWNYSVSSVSETNFCFFPVCQTLVSCVPNVASFSGLPFLFSPTFICPGWWSSDFHINTVTITCKGICRCIPKCSLWWRRALLYFPYYFPKKSYLYGDGNLDFMMNTRTSNLNRTIDDTSMPIWLS